MPFSALLSRTSRRSQFMAFGGAFGFALGIGDYLLFGPQWLVQVLGKASAPIPAAAMGVIFALAASTLTAIVVIARVRAKYRLVRSALNTMTQGLCMFDRAGRLILCNDSYIEMYHLDPEHATRGTSLRELLVGRAAAGTFSGDPDAYVTDCLQRVAQGRTETKTVEVKDGRVIALVSRPVAGGARSCGSCRR